MLQVKVLQKDQRTTTGPRDQNYTRTEPHFWEKKEPPPICVLKIMLSVKQKPEGMKNCLMPVVFPKNINICAPKLVTTHKAEKETLGQAKRPSFPGMAWPSRVPAGCSSRFPSPASPICTCIPGPHRPAAGSRRPRSQGGRHAHSTPRTSVTVYLKMMGWTSA